MLVILGVWLALTVVHPLSPHVQKLFNDTKFKIYHLQQSLSDASSMVEELDRLKSHNALLNSRVVQQQMHIEKIHNIKGLNSYHFDEKTSFIIKLNLIDYRGDRKRMFFNLEHDVQASKGDGIINESGLIGTVASIDNKKILVKALSDQDSNFAIVDQRTGQHYIAQGLGYNDLIELLYVSENEDVKEGDVILSSGMGNHLPHGLKIGTIINVDIPPGSSFFNVKIKLEAKPGYGEYYSLLH